MRDWDIQALFHFIRRPEMYTGATKVGDFKRIDLFLMAYEMGAQGECKFRDRLWRQIEEKYAVQMPGEGLGAQLRKASKKTKQPVWGLFIQESMEILVAESDQNQQNRFVRYKRKLLIEQLEQLPEKINCTWTLFFSREIRELKDWTGANLTEEEWRKSERLIEELNQLTQHDACGWVSVPDSIQMIKGELLEKLYDYTR